MSVIITNMTNDTSENLHNLVSAALDSARNMNIKGDDLPVFAIIFLAIGICFSLPIILAFMNLLYQIVGGALERVKSHRRINNASIAILQAPDSVVIDMGVNTRGTGFIELISSDARGMTFISAPYRPYDMERKEYVFRRTSNKILVLKERRKDNILIEISYILIESIDIIGIRREIENKSIPWLSELNKLGKGRELRAGGSFNTILHDYVDLMINSKTGNKLRIEINEIMDKYITTINDPEFQKISDYMVDMDKYEMDLILFNNKESFKDIDYINACKLLLKYNS